MKIRVRATTRNNNKFERQYLFAGEILPRIGEQLTIRDLDGDKATIHIDNINHEMVEFLDGSLWWLDPKFGQSEIIVTGHVIDKEKGD